MRTLVILSPGPNWIEGPLEKQDRAVFWPHLIRMRELYDEGTLLFGGPARTGGDGIAILETASGEEATELMRGDPAVQAGALTFAVTWLGADIARAEPVVRRFS
jgi:uncharacterized protein YciI